jgi:hypothetical protein
MHIVMRTLILVQSGTTPLQVAEEHRHTSIATLIRNAAKRLEDEEARAAASAAAAQLIAVHHDAKADAALIDQSIAQLN